MNSMFADADGQETAREYFCHICFESQSVSLGKTLKCGHTFCAECLLRYLDVKISEGDVHPKCFHPIEKPMAPSSEPSAAGAQNVVPAPLPQNNWKPDDSTGYNASSNMSIYSAMTFLGLNGLSNTVSEGKYFADPPTDTHGTEILDKADIVNIEPDAVSSTSSSVVTEPLSSRKEGFALNSAVDPMSIDETEHSNLCRSLYLLNEPGSRPPVDHSSGVGNQDKGSVCVSAAFNSTMSASAPVSTTVRDAAANDESPPPQSNPSGNPVPDTAAGAKDICNVEFSSEEIMSIIESDDELVDKYKYFQFTKQNPDARECPRCKALQMGSAVTPSMTCGSCGCVYCFFHSGAHPNRTCEEYEKSIAPEVARSQALIDATSKPCPGCQLFIEKSGGCNHMKCTNCGTAFCWLCGKAIDDDVFPAHFQWWNPAGCANLQMNEALEPSTGTRCCARATTIIEIVLLGPLVAISTFLSVALCCCFVPLMLPPREDEKERERALMYGRTYTPRSLRQRLQMLFSTCMSGWGMFYIGILIIVPVGAALVVIVAGAVIGLAAVCYPFYAIYRLYYREYPWPDEVGRVASNCGRSLVRFLRCSCRLLRCGRCRRALASTFCGHRLCHSFCWRCVGSNRNLSDSRNYALYSLPSDEEPSRVSVHTIPKTSEFEVEAAMHDIEVINGAGVDRESSAVAVVKDPTDKYKQYHDANSHILSSMGDDDKDSKRQRLDDVEDLESGRRKPDSVVFKEGRVSSRRNSRHQIIPSGSSDIPTSGSFREEDKQEEEEEAKYDASERMDVADRIIDILRDMEERIHSNHNNNSKNKSKGTPGRDPFDPTAHDRRSSDPFGGSTDTHHTIQCNNKEAAGGSGNRDITTSLDASSYDLEMGRPAHATEAVPGSISGMAVPESPSGPLLHDTIPPPTNAGASFGICSSVAGSNDTAEESNLQSQLHGGKHDGDGNGTSIGAKSDSQEFGGHHRLSPLPSFLPSPRSENRPLSMPTSTSGLGRLWPFPQFSAPASLIQSEDSHDEEALAVTDAHTHMNIHESLATVAVAASVEGAASEQRSSSSSAAINRPQFETSSSATKASQGNSHSASMDRRETAAGSGVGQNSSVTAGGSGGGTRQFISGPFGEFVSDMTRVVDMWQRVVGLEESTDEEVARGRAPLPQGPPLLRSISAPLPGSAPAVPVPVPSLASSVSATPSLYPNNSSVSNKDTTISHAQLAGTINNTIVTARGSPNSLGTDSVSASMTIQGSTGARTQSTTYANQVQLSPTRSPEGSSPMTNRAIGKQPQQNSTGAAEAADDDASINNHIHNTGTSDGDGFPEGERKESKTGEYSSLDGPPIPMRTTTQRSLSVNVRPPGWINVGDASASGSGATTPPLMPPSSANVPATATTTSVPTFGSTFAFGAFFLGNRSTGPGGSPRPVSAPPQAAASSSSGIDESNTREAAGEERAQPADSTDP